MGNVLQFALHSKPSTSFAVHIAHVVCERAKEKMLGIGAFWIVALVQYAHSFRNWPEVNFPRRAVRWNFLVRLKSALDHSIPKRMLGSVPFPAVFGFFNLSPKTVCQWAVRLADYGHKALYPYQVEVSNG